MWHGTFLPSSGQAVAFARALNWSINKVKHKRTEENCSEITEWGCVRLSKRFAQNSNFICSLAILTVLSSLRVTSKLFIFQAWIDSDFPWLFLCLVAQCCYSGQLIALQNLLVYSHFVWNITFESCYLLQQCRFKLLKPQQLL